MQTPQSIIDQMRRRVKVDTSQYTDADALKDLNTLKDEFWSALITNVAEDYNWDRWFVNLTTTDSEYSIPTVAYNTAWTKILKQVAISYEWDTYKETWNIQYTPAREVNPNTLEHDWFYYVEKQDKKDPIYFVADNSLFIAPSFRTAWLVDRIKLTWIRKIPDYSLTTTEADMKISVDQQQALVYGLMIDWYFNKWVDDNTINNAAVRWENKKQEAIRTLSVRVESPTTFKYPDEIINEDFINLTRA